MILVPRNHLQHFHASKITPIYHILSLKSSKSHTNPVYNNPHLAYAYSSSSLFHYMRSTHITNFEKNPPLIPFSRRSACYSSNAIRPPIGPPTRSLRRRMRKRALAATRPILDESRFHKAISKLQPGFTHEQLHDVMVVEKNALLCLELFNWASKQNKFRHNVLTYHIAIKKLGAVKMYQEMDDIVNQVLAVSSIGTEDLYNTMIYYFVEARKLIRAVNIYNHMRSSKKLDCRPSIKTHKILFEGILNRGKVSNPYVDHMYMENIRSLFKQMVDDGIEPDVFILNCMIKGYILSLHVNDALRIFHQMEVVYNCLPNSVSYDCLIHGLCVQGRTNNARELFDEMTKKGFVLSSKTCNTMINALVLGGEIDEGVKLLKEMSENRRKIDFITYRTVFDEICRKRRVEDARHLLEDLHGKEVLDGHTYNKLLNELQED